MAWNTFESDVPPLKTQVSPNSDVLKIRPSSQQTQKSFSTITGSMPRVC